MLSNILFSNKSNEQGGKISVRAILEINWNMNPKWKAVSGFGLFRKTGRCQASIIFTIWTENRQQSFAEMYTTNGSLYSLLSQQY